MYSIYCLLFFLFCFSSSFIFTELLSTQAIMHTRSQIWVSRMHNLIIKCEFVCKVFGIEKKTKKKKKDEEGKIWNMPLSLLNQTTIVLMASVLVQARIPTIKNETKTICSFFLPSFWILTHSTAECVCVSLCVNVRLCLCVRVRVFAMETFTFELLSTSFAICEFLHVFNAGFTHNYARVTNSCAIHLRQVAWDIAFRVASSDITWISHLTDTG